LPKLREEVVSNGAATGFAGTGTHLLIIGLIEIWQRQTNAIFDAFR
jgi:hypothetical protein